MKPRFVGRLGAADAISATNAALGFVAVVLAPRVPEAAARLVLLAAVADGLDGVVARRYGGSEPGPYLDSLADVASFGVAPAAIVASVASRRWPLWEGSAMAYVAVALPALFVATAVVRLALYTAHDTRDHVTVGVPSTLAATVIAAAVLAGVARPATLLGATAVFCYLMVSTVEYPDLLHVDALVMGVVNVLAVAFPDLRSAGFAYALLFLALAYLVFGPRFYWRDVDRSARPGDAGDGDDAAAGEGNSGDRPPSTDGPGDAPAESSDVEPPGDGHQESPSVPRDAGAEGKRS